MCIETFYGAHCKNPCIALCIYMYGIYSDMQQRNEPTGLLQICQLSVIGVFGGELLGQSPLPFPELISITIIKTLKWTTNTVKPPPGHIVDIIVH